jgi:pyruvate dehydrogenase E2 component (dihydrolipoamide acetyltransferase)
MATVVVMPKLGLTMTEGTVETWLKSEGERVEKGEPLLVIITEKVTYEYEAPASGILRVIIHQEGEVVPVATPIAVIAGGDEELPDIEALEREEVEVAPMAAPAVQQAVSSPNKGERIFASPLARRIAREEGVDLTAIQGTGPGGRVVKEDVMRAIRDRAEAPPAVAKEALPGRVIPMKGIRRIIAQRMSESTRTIPHFFLSVEADMTGALQLRERLLEEVEKKAGVRLSVTDILVKVAARALRDHPIINSRIEGEGIRLVEEINIGVAVAIEEGLIVPVVRAADGKTLTEIAVTIRDLAQKARNGKLSVDDVTGGTFTLSNLGMFGIDTFNAIINPPECSILGVGRTVEKPVVEKGEVTIKPIAWLTLSADHRIVDGASASQFLQRLRELLENPYFLLS